MDLNKKFKNQEEVFSYAKEHNRVLVIFDNYVLDATTFAKHHPGGEGLILNYKSKNITDQMKGHFPLSLKMANTMLIGSIQKDIRRVIDPTKALMPQIWNMDHQSYLKLVQSPHWLFVESPRMFESSFCQLFSHNQWYAIYPIPLLIACLVYSNLNFNEFTYLNPFYFVLAFMSGVFLWTITEYCLHRFIFHSQKHLFDNRILRYLHFILHGIHHMMPIDPDRLVYPPFLAVVTIFVGYFTVYQIMQFSNPFINAAFWAGFLLGYWVYDTIHYCLHHVKARKGSWFHKLQQYHNRHHFSGQQAGFGVSNPLWDIILNTGYKNKPNH